MSTGDDERRAEVVAAYEDVDRPAHSELRALAELAALAALVCQVPMAAIDLDTPTGRHRAAAAGETGEVRFSAAHQLCTPDGLVVGTLGVFDDRPRELTPDQRSALGTLAERAVDVLELGRATRRLADAEARLAAADERLATFAGQISHDLKNPLTAVAMSLEMGLEEAAEAEDADLLVSLLDRAARGAGRMQRMIDDLFAFARGGSAPELVAVDLASLVAEVLEELAGLRGTAAVETGALPVVAADQAQLRVVLRNLVANALTFTRDGVEPHVVVAAERVDDHWRVRVTDNGRGVPEEKRDQVFEPFTRLDKGVPGTGVGLATSRRIVEAHGGRIGLTDAPGGGATVWFLLPADRGPDAAGGSVPV